MNGWLRNLSRCFKHVTVEPMVFLFMFTIYLWYPLSTELIYENILGDSGKDCGTNDTDNKTKCEEEQNFAQEEVSRIQNYISASRHVPAFFSALILGPFTDRYGRRPAMVLSCLGNAVWTTGLLLNVYLKFSVYYFLIGATIDGLCGGISTFLFASFAYIADTSTEVERTKKIALTESMIFLGGFIASIAGGFWSDKRGFAAPLFAVLCCYAIILLYITCWLTEPRKVYSLKNFNLKHHLRRTCSVLFSPKGYRRSLCLSLLTFTILIAVFAGTNNIFILFLLDEPYNWSNTGIGFFVAFNTLLNGIVTLFALPAFNRVAGDFWTAFVGVVAAFIGSLFVGISAADWMLFVGATIGAVGSMATPTLRSEMSKMVSPHSQGSLFSLMSAAEILCALISSSTISKIYESTHDYYHGFCFLIEAGLALITIPLLISHKLLKSEEEKDDKEELVVEPESDPATSPTFVMSALEEDDDYPATTIQLRSQLTLQTVLSPPPSQARILPPPKETEEEEEEGFQNIELVDQETCGHVTCSNMCHGTKQSDSVTI